MIATEVAAPIDVLGGAVGRALVLRRATLLFQRSESRLGVLAQRALDRGLAPADVVLVCVEVDSVWRGMVDQLMPGHDWRSIRERGESPVARGSVLREGLVEELKERAPGVAFPLEQPPAPGHLHAAVFVDAGACVFAVTPGGEPPQAGTPATPARPSS